MFCPFCHRQVADDELFCLYCRKALPKKSQNILTNELTPSKTKKTSKPGFLSANAIRVGVTAIAVTALIVIILQIYYPTLLPWNW